MEDKKTESLFENEGVNPFDANYGKKKNYLDITNSLFFFPYMFIL